MAMTKEKVAKILEDSGYTADRWGNYVFERGVTKYRIKLQARTVRIEKRVHMSTHNEWFRIGGGFYKDVHVINDGAALNLVSYRLPLVGDL